MKKMLVVLLIVSMLSTLLMFQGGVSAVGNFNYGEALQKSILFYEFQRSGKLPETGEEIQPLKTEQMWD